MRILAIAIETTGLRPGNIIQLSCLEIDTTTNEKKAHNQFFLVDDIPEETTKINGYTLDIVKELSNNHKITQYKNGILKILSECDLIVSQDINFTINFLQAELKDVKSVIKGKRQLSLSKEYMPIIKKKSDVLEGYAYVKLNEIISYLGYSGSEIRKITRKFYPNIKNNNFSDSRYKVIGIALGTMEAIKRNYFPNKTTIIS